MAKKRLTKKLNKKIDEKVDQKIADMMTGSMRPGTKTFKKLIDAARSDLDSYRGYLREITNPNPILRYTDEGLRSGIGIFRQIEGDDQAGGDLQARQQIVRSFPWDIVVDSDLQEDQEQAEELKEMLKPIMRRLLKEMQDAQVVGFSATELFWTWNPQTNRVELPYVEGLYQENLTYVLPEKSTTWMADEKNTYGLDWQLHLKTDFLKTHPVPPERVVLAVFDQLKGNMYGRSLLTRTFWPWWFKKHAFLFWSQYLEKFGQPTVVGQVPPGTPKEKEQAFLQALENIQSNFAVTIPENWKAELLEASRSGGANSYNDFVNVCNRAISKTILMSVLTTNEALHGSKAHAESQKDLMLECLHDDANWMQDEVTLQVVKPLAEWNFNFSVPPRFIINYESEDVSKEAAERDKIVQEIVPVPVEHFMEKYNVPTPENDDALVAFGGAIHRWGDIREKGIKPSAPALPVPGQPGQPGDQVADPATPDQTGDPAAADQPEPESDEENPPVEFAEKNTGGIVEFDDLIDDEDEFIEQFYDTNIALLEKTIDVGQVQELLDKAKDYPEAIAAIDSYKSKRGQQTWEKFLKVARLTGEYSVKKQVEALEKAGSAPAQFAEADNQVKFDEAAFRKLTPKAAIKWLRKKIAVKKAVWGQIEQDARNASFYISRLGDLELIKFFKEQCLEALGQGIPYRQFAKKLFLLTGGTPFVAYQKTAYYTNMFSALGVQSQTAMRRVTDRFPYWRYSAILDGKTRDSHARMHGVVVRHDDPFWSTWYPPNGFNCRCRVTIATEQMFQASREMLPGLQPDPGFDHNAMRSNMKVLREAIGDKEEYIDQFNGRLRSAVGDYLKTLKKARKRAGEVADAA
jgi:SPP1 gp7 family putative phage head morphogenesis protein